MRRAKGEVRSVHGRSKTNRPLIAISHFALRTSHFFACLLLLGCGPSGRTPLVIYSPHGRDLLTLLQHRFEQLHPDVQVQWLDMGSQEVYDRVSSERANPQGDVWFGGPGTILARAAEDSLLQAFRPTWADAIPAGERAPGDLYFSAYRTPVVLIYPEQALQPAQAPHDWDDLLAPQWKGKVVIRDPIASGTMRAVWGLIIERGLAATGDTAAGFAWLRRLDAQTREYVINETILEQKLIRREGLVSIWDLPDILLNRRDGMQMGYTFPTSGTPVIQDAIAVIRGARHPELARTFVEWVGSMEAQLLATRQAFRLPARTDIPADSLPSWAQEVNRRMTAAPMDWAQLAKHQAEWMRYWDEHVRAHGGEAR